MKKVIFTLVMTLAVTIVNAQSPIDFGGSSNPSSDAVMSDPVNTESTNTGVQADALSNSDIAANTNSQTYSYRVPRNQVNMQSAPANYSAPASAGRVSNNQYITSTGQVYNIITVSQGYFWGQRPAAKAVYFGNNLASIQASYPEVDQVMVLNGYYFITFAQGEAAPANAAGGVLLPGAKIYHSTKTNAWHLADCGNKIASFEKVGDVVNPNPAPVGQGSTTSISPSGDVVINLTVNNTNTNTSNSTAEANNSGIRIVNPPVVTPNPIPSGNGNSHIDLDPSTHPGITDNHGRFWTWVKRNGKTILWTAAIAGGTYATYKYGQNQGWWNGSTGPVVYTNTVGTGSTISPNGNGTGWGTAGTGTTGTTGTVATTGGNGNTGGW